MIFWSTVSCKYRLWGIALRLSLIASISKGATLHLESVITGNQEQPTVLFVMPWQPLREPQLNEGELPSEMPTRLMQSYTPEAFTRLVERPGVVTNAFTLPSGEASNGE